MESKGTCLRATNMSYSENKQRPLNKNVQVTEKVTLWKAQRMKQRKVMRCVWNSGLISCVSALDEEQRGSVDPTLRLGSSKLFQSAWGLGTQLLIQWLVMWVGNVFKMCCFLELWYLNSAERQGFETNLNIL